MLSTAWICRQGARHSWFEFALGSTPQQCCMRQLSTGLHQSVYITACNPGRHWYIHLAHTHLRVARVLLNACLDVPCCHQHRPRAVPVRHCCALQVEWQRLTPAPAPVYVWLQGRVGEAGPRLMVHTRGGRTEGEPVGREGRVRQTAVRQGGCTVTCDLFTCHAASCFRNGSSTKPRPASPQNTSTHQPTHT
jgi:hypothetical protein